MKERCHEKRNEADRESRVSVAKMVKKMKRLATERK